MKTLVRSLRPEAVASLLQRLQEVTAGDAAAAELARVLTLPLEREDAERGNNLVATLRAYYSCHARVDKTADTLFLHRNSVRYRLDRIRWLLGLDIDQPNAIAALTIALAYLQRAAEEQTHAG
ncbi:MAG: helix-turn-helix domain-containing protein [Candidatus Eremiobacteraeota bacterium]|nr:helix-turn-helix domain-containing protein [Candidatus Eremiobacteraeota bacterium]